MQCLLLLKRLEMRLLQKNCTMTHHHRMMPMTMLQVHLLKLSSKDVESSNQQSHTQKHHEPQHIDKTSVKKHGQSLTTNRN